ncbi:unnamed protein product [Leptosia nina]|uniref:Fibronectin type-III domain-containing protein n=1 Tax=Leptosia nina TaxID=320188 RepID=A0AAV1JCM4_9NEOP
MGIYTLSPIVKCGLYAFFTIINIPILQGEEQSQCPSLTENPICPCYNFKEGLFLECPSATPNVVKNVLAKIKGSIQSLSIYDLESSITELKSDLFPPKVKIINLQISQSNIDTVNQNAFTSLRDSLASLSIISGKLKRIPQESFSQLHNIETLDLQLNEINEIHANTFQNLKLNKINLKGNKIENISENAFHYLEETLTELDITENFLYIFPLKPLENLRKLSSLRLAWNKIESIPNNLNVTIERLYSLDLSSNVLTRIEKNWLNCVPNIKTLTVFSNQIKHIDDEAFYSLRNLETIDLSRNKLNNRINHIGKETFDNLIKMKILDLSYNEIISLDFEMSSLPVKQIRLNHNSITIIQSDSLKALPNLSDLDMNSNFLTWEDVTQIQIPGLKSLVLSNNNFTLLEVTTFSHLPSLQSLSLEMSNITYLPPPIFIKNQNLLRVNLASNYLKDLHKDIFAYTTILQELNLKSNSFADFPHVALFNVTSLEHLNLCDNQLRSVDFFKFTGLQNLRTLHLCNNRISILNGFNSPSLKNLVTLNLNNNMLTVLPPNFFQHSLGLKEIDLSHNFFKHIPSNGLSETVLPALTTLNMSSNSLVQLLQTYPIKQFPMLEQLIITNTNLTIITSKDFENFPSLKKLILKTNCLVRLSPGAFSKLHNLASLDMSENKLENIPRERLQGLYSATVLNISQNTIRELEEFTADLQNLQRLDLSFNHITRINKGIFQNLHSLTELNLSGNWLSFIATDTFKALNKIIHIDLSKNYFEVIQIKMLVSLETQVKTIAYDENPLTCNCESQETWKWMQNHYKIVLKGSSNLRCEHPEELHGYSFLELTSQKLCDVPVVIRIAIQDIQTYSVIVSWQSRNQSGLSGYQVAYYKEQMPALIRGKILNATARMTRLSHLTPGAKYKICVIAMGNFGVSGGSSVPDARIAPSSENISAQLYGDELLFNHLRGYMNDSQTGKCTTVTTIEIFGTSLDSPFSNTYMGIADILTRRLSLVVGCCIGFIVFIVLVSAFGYVKTKKRPVIAKAEQPTPQYISYDNFPVPNIESQAMEIDINTITDSTKPQFKSCD